MPKNSDTSSSGPGKYENSGRGADDAHGADALDMCDSAVVLDTIGAVLHAGDSIQFGTTRDGGAVVIQLYSEGAIDKLYAASQEELEHKLQAIQETAQTPF